jgi:DNA repair ATPase RecN
MLTRLSIRDIVLIEQLDVDFSAGLSVLTGETGTGKSILLDACALALGARGDAALVRHGADQGQVTGVFEPPFPAAARDVLGECGIAAKDELILRRTQLADGRTRAFVNDQPVSAQALRRLGNALWRFMASMRSVPCSILRRTARCSMPSEGWNRGPRKSQRYGRSIGQSRSNSRASANG